MTPAVEEAIERIRRAAATDARRNGWIAKLSIFYNLVVFPATIALLTANFAPLGAVGWWAFWIPMGVACAIAFVLFLIQVLGPANVVDLYFHSQEIIRKAKSLMTEQERARALLRTAATSNPIILGWISSVPEYVGHGISNEEDFQEAVDEILGQIVEHRGDLFGISDYQEKWNFAVFLYDKGRDALTCVAREKHSKHPGARSGREWRPGQGHVGKAFADRTTKITRDSQLEDVQNLMADPEMERTYDRDVYRSYASVPIGLDQVDGRPYGVIVATSDAIGRYTIENSNILRIAASVLASIIEVGHHLYGVSPPVGNNRDAHEPTA